MRGGGGINGNGQPTIYIDGVRMQNFEAGAFAIGGATTGDYYVQSKYLVDPLGLTTVTPIELITWQETQFMRAELVLRGAGAGDALALMNGVRAWYPEDPADCCGNFCSSSTAFHPS